MVVSLRNLRVTVWHKPISMHDLIPVVICRFEHIRNFSWASQLLICHI